EAGYQQKSPAPRTGRTRIPPRQFLQERTLQDDEDSHHRSRTRCTSAETPLRRWQGQPRRLRCLCSSRPAHWKPWIQQQRMDRQLQGYTDAFCAERRSLPCSSLLDPVQEDELWIRWCQRWLARCQCQQEDDMGIFRGV